MKKTGLILFIFFSCTQSVQAFDPLSAYGQETPKGCTAASVHKGQLGLTELIEIGLCRNPSLSRNYMAVKSSEASLGQAKSAYLPSVEASATIAATHYQTQDIRDHEKAEPFVGNVALSWLLLDFGGRSANTEMMRSYLDSASFTYNAALHDTVLAINQAYFDLLGAREVLKSAEKNVASYKKSYEETEKKFKLGKITTSERLLAKTTYQKSKLAVIQAENNIKKYQADLAALLNLAPQTRFNLKAPSKNDKKLTALQDNLPVEDLIRTALNLRPELKSAESLEKAAAKAVTAAKSKAAPVLSLNVEGNYNDQWKESNPYKYGAEVGLTVSMPLFTGFSDMYGIAKAKFDRRQAASVIKETQNAVKKEVWSIYHDYQTAVAAYEINQDVLKSAQENERVSMAAYKAGRETLLNLLTVQAQLASARESDIVSFYTVLTSKAALYRAVGKF